MSVDMEIIKKLREETGAGILEVKKTLDSVNGDEKQARDILMAKVSEKAAKKADRETKDGLIFSYLHAGGRIGSFVSLACETDFVAKTDAFLDLGKNIAMQICTEDYPDNEALLSAEYIRDPSKSINDLIKEATAKVGEKIEILKFTKYVVGE